MPEIKEEDRQDFENRLAKYNLDASALLAQELITTRSTITQLYIGALGESKFRPIVLKTSDFDQVNRWIGVPDVLAEQEDYNVEIPRRVRLPGVELRRAARAPREEKLEFSRENMTSEDLAQVREVARAYLRGNSRGYIAYKPLIEAVFPVVSISVWPFLNITVKSGSVLEFGPGPNVLVAYTLTIEEGGLVRSYGDLTVDAIILQKENPRVVFELDPGLLRAAEYPRRLRLRSFES